MLNRKQFLSSLAVAAPAVAAALAASSARAQGARTLEWVVGYPAGGGSDMVARTVAEAMSRTLGRTIAVVNKPGAGTNIAAEYVVRSKSPGDIVFTADFATLAANPHLFAKLTYDAERDLVPVGLLVRFPMFLAVGNGVPAADLKGFTAWARAQPQPVSWGSAGVGSPHRLIGELFRERTKLPLSHVPYRGAAPAIQDVVGGQIPAMWVDSATVIPFANAGRVKLIGVASAARVALLPEARTFAEQGLAGFEGHAWQGLTVPAGTPAAATAEFARALQEALASTGVRARLQALGVEPLPGTPAQMAQMAQFAAAERRKWGEVVARAGIKLD